MAIILPKFGLKVPSETTLHRNLGKEFREMGESIETILEAFNYNGADPGTVLSRVVALESFRSAYAAKHANDHPWTTQRLLAPFAPYDANSRLDVARDGDLISLRGVITCNTAGHLTSASARSIAQLPGWAVPTLGTVNDVAQGSGNDRMYLAVSNTGLLTGSRYSGTQNAGVWIPIDMTYRI